eukprot:scaffold56867_cov33-Prasinocladus_malaysianus.AAC.1
MDARNDQSRPDIFEKAADGAGGATSCTGRIVEDLYLDKLRICEETSWDTSLRWNIATMECCGHLLVLETGCHLPSRVALDILRPDTCRLRATESP